MSDTRKRSHGKRPIRRGVETVPLYANIRPGSREALREIVAATGETQNHVIEQIIAHVAENLNSDGVPTWWSEPLVNHEQEQLPMTG